MMGQRNMNDRENNDQIRNSYLLRKRLLNKSMRRSQFRDLISREIAKILAEWPLTTDHHQAIMADINRLVMRYSVAKLNPFCNHFILLARLLAQVQMQATGVVKYLFRLLVRYREAWQTQRIIDMLQSNTDTLLVGLRSLQIEFKKYHAERAKAAAYPSSYRRSLLQFLSHLFGDRPAPLLELVEPDRGLATYTDGMRIYLPNRIDLGTGDNGDRVNVGLIYHSVVHEALHLGVKGHRGTYDFSFETPLGVPLLKRLRRFRRVFDRNVMNWDGDAVFYRIAREEGINVDQKQPVLTDLVAFYMFAQQRQLLQFLMNAFEDLRIERVIQRSGFRELSEHHAELAIRQWSHPLLDDDSQALTNYILQAMVGRKKFRVLPKKLKKVAQDIDSYFGYYHGMNLDLMSPESSAVLAWDLYRAMLKNLPPATRAQWNCNLQPQTSATEVSIRQQLARMFDDGSTGGTGRPLLHRRKELPNIGSNLYDEFDHTSGKVVSNATQVTVKTFVPQRKPYPTAPLRTFQMPRPTNLVRNAHRAQTHFKFREHGEVVELERVIPAMAAIRSGRPYDRRLYRTRASEIAKPLVSVLIDLSVSMEQRRTGMEARSIQLAIDATKRIYQASRERGFELQVFGLIDGGRQSVSLYRVPLSGIEQVHCLGVGGARIGAAIRHLGRQSHPDREQQIIVLSDDGGAYLRYGNDEKFKKVWKNCASCQLRRLAGKGCHIELGRKAEARSGLFFESMEYQYADIDHAVRTIPANNSVFYVEFASKPYSHLLDFYLPDRWWSSTGALDLSAT